MITRGEAGEAVAYAADRGEPRPDRRTVEPAGTIGSRAGGAAGGCTGPRTGCGCLLRRRGVILPGMTDHRRSLGLPESSGSAADRPVTPAARRALPPVDRALFLPPPTSEPPAPAPARRVLAGGGLEFSSPG